MSEKEFNNLVIPLSNKLLNICYGVLGNREEAKDALQEIYIKLWRDKDKLLSLRSIEAYARSVTRNHCLDTLRMKKSRVAIDQANFFLQEIDSNEREEMINYRLGLVRSALVHLNELQQQVFTMRDLEGMEFEEISEILGITSENARVTLSRARKNIRDFVYSKMIKQKG